MSRRPPLGVKPMWLHNEQRFNEITEAIIRYNEQGIAAPLEFIGEWQSLHAYLEGRKKEIKDTEESSKPFEWTENDVKNILYRCLPSEDWSNVYAWVEQYKQSPYPRNESIKAGAGTAIGVLNTAEFNCKKEGLYTEKSLRHQPQQESKRIEVESYELKLSSPAYIDNEAIKSAIEKILNNE